MNRPDLTEAPEWYHRYINTVKENNLSEALHNQISLFNDFFTAIPVEKRDFRYAAGKWSIKDIIQHLIDGERVFAYRILRFARKDETPLPGFEENDYAENAKAENRNWEELIEEFNVVRRSTEFLINSLDEDQLQSKGIANSSPISVLAIGFIIVGHTNHHLSVIKERYL